MKMTDRIKRNMQTDKPMTLISLRLPDHVIEDLKEVAPSLGFGGYQALIRAYISNGLRKHLAEREAQRAKDNTVEEFSQRLADTRQRNSKERLQPNSPSHVYLDTTKLVLCCCLNPVPDPARRQELAREATRDLLGDRFAYTLAVHVPLAMNSKACRLTVLREHYRLLVAKADLMRPCCRTSRQSSRSDAKVSPGKRVRNFWRSSKLSKVSRTPIFRSYSRSRPGAGDDTCVS